MRRLTFFIVAIILLSGLFEADSHAQDLEHRPLQKLIDCPSAGGPEYHSYDFEMRASANGGILTGFTIGLFQRFALGIFYGGTGVIGYGKPDWNPQPGVLVQYRILNETVALPALSIGFNNQGFGTYSDSTNRYQFKSKGFFAVTGKNFTAGHLGEFGGHFGINQNPVSGEDNRFDFWAALDYHPSSQLAFILEYSAALNDYGRTESQGDGHGYMNAGLRWSFAERLALDLIFRDILNNQKDDIRGGEQIGREIRISYIEILN